MATQVYVLALTCLFIAIAPALGWVPRLVSGRPRGGFLGSPPTHHNVHVPEEKYFEWQKLDHFNAHDIRQWKQRFFVNETLYRDGGPIFLMLGGEAALNPVWMVDGTWIQYAEMYGAVAVMLEHRYYGMSRPTDDLSTENLEFLSSEQALEDVADFIKYFRLFYHVDDNKLIVFGGSYSGSLAAWFRSKYPYMADGAVASSAPIVAKMDFMEYFEVVKTALDTTGPECAREIRNATWNLLGWWDQAPTRAEMYTKFKLCDKINSQSVDAPMDYAGIFSTLADNFGGVVQYNNDNRAFEGAIGTNITIETLCDIMTDSSRGDNIQRLADVNTLMLDTYSQKCLDYKYSKLVSELKQTEWNSSVAEGARQWLYQTCAEFGWFQSSESTHQPFGDWFSFPFNYSLDQCQSLFGFSFYVVDDNIDETNTFYGGLKLPISNVVFVNGDIDPWHAMGVTSDLSPDATAKFLSGTAHCADMYPETSHDPSNLVSARWQVGQLIAKWIM